MARILVLGNGEFRTSVVKRLASLGHESVQVDVGAPMPDHPLDSASSTPPFSTITQVRRAVRRSFVASARVSDSSRQ